MLLLFSCHLQALVGNGAEDKAISHQQTRLASDILRGFRREKLWILVFSFLSFVLCFLLFLNSQNHIQTKQGFQYSWWKKMRRELTYLGGNGALSLISKCSFYSIALINELWNKYSHFFCICDTGISFHLIFFSNINAR